MRRILTAHAARYPHWGLDDLYKLIHQAAVGSEHAVSDETHARGWLTRELASLGAGPEEPLIDPISPGNEVLRVHLRPFVRLRLEGELLLEAFIRTAREFQGSADRIVEYAETAADLAREGLLRFGGDEVTQLVARMKEAGFPAVHHSASFEAEYRPAYRVVARHELPPEIIAAA
jgi:hypothetical protein